MTLQNPALFINGESHPAEDVRRWVSAMVADTGGLIGSTDFAVSENGTPNMSVDADSGRAFVKGDESTYQGVYFVENRGAVNLAISASDGTNPRKDLVVLYIEDGQYSGANYQATLGVVTGTPAASPVEPAVPSSALVLAMVDVGAGVTSITNANIEDRRSATNGLATPLGGVVPCTTTTRPASPRSGQPIFETDSGKTRIWNGVSWQGIAYDDALTTAVPAGLVSAWMMDTGAPSGWLELNGQTVAGAQGTYPDLWAAAPSSWKSGSDLTLPDMGGRVPVGLDTGDSDFNAIRETGGNKAHVLGKGNLPHHYHEMDHDHGTKTTSEDGNHGHGIRTKTNTSWGWAASLRSSGVYWATGSTNGLLVTATASSSYSAAGNDYYVAYPEGDHDHTVAIGNFTGNTENGAEDGLKSAPDAVSNVQPYFTVRFIIKT